jgi:hypothetical protein
MEVDAMLMYRGGQTRGVSCTPASVASAPFMMCMGVRVFLGVVILFYVITLNSFVEVSPPVLAVQRNIVITGNHEFQFCIDTAKHLQSFLVHRQAADLS